MATQLEMIGHAPKRGDNAATPAGGMYDYLGNLSAVRFVWGHGHDHLNGRNELAINECTSVSAVGFTSTFPICDKVVRLRLPLGAGDL